MNENFNSSLPLSGQSFSVSDYRWPCVEGRKPLGHQKQTVAFFLTNKRAFCLSEMGTMKTLSALWAVDILITARKVRRVLIISPLSGLRATWGAEIFRNMPYLKYGIAHGTKQQRLNVLRSTVPIVIINHDGIKTVEEELLKNPPDIIIIDELTAYKANSDRTKCMQKIADKARAVWGLTGEPTPNSPLEAYSQAKIVNPFNPLLTGPLRYYTQYRDATMTKINDILYIPKPYAAEIVSSILRPAIRFTRDQCLDLPPTTYETVDIPFTDDQEKYYALMKKQAMIEFSEGKVTASSAAIKLNKLLQISAGSVKLNDGTIQQIDCRPRLKALKEIYEQTPQKKMIVFAVFRATIDMLVENLNASGIKTQPIYGGISLNERSKSIESFQTGDTNVLVIQPQSGAHSLNLQVSSTAVWFSLIPSNELYQQANARIVRPGQKRNTLIIHMISSKAEEHIANILDKKAVMSKAVLDLFKDNVL